MIMTVAIKFCGGCNPRIDRTGVARSLASQLAAWGITVVYNRLDADFVVYLSGCSVSCASRELPPDPRACTVIAGSSLDTAAVDEAELSALAIEKVRDCLGKMERPL